MNLVRDAEGAITFGAVETNVYYSHFSGKLSVRLGAAHLKDLQQSLELGGAVSYFADSSELTSYDLLARSALVRLLLSQRRRFAEVVILSSGGRVSPTGQVLAATVGEPVRMLDDRNEFDRRLTTASPRALEVIRGASGPPSAQAPSSVASAAQRAHR
jgi:hypothetical protein